MPVLLVEDDTALRSLISTLMSRAAISLETVGRGDAAIERLATNTYDAIILDLLVPGRTGYEILSHLYARQAALLSRVIVVTATPESELRHRFFFEDLVWQLIRKPFDIHTLVGAVLACVGAHGEASPVRPDVAAWMQEEAEAAGAFVAVAAVVGAHNDLQLVASWGDDADRTDVLYPLPLRSSFPICRAARTAQEIYVGALEAEHLAAPGLRQMLMSGRAQVRERRSIAALPLRDSSGTFGALALAFAQPQAFDAVQRDLLRQTAERCAALLRMPTGNDVAAVALQPES